ncbi:hypothetical protein ACLKA6_015215 [Drosophila palustris]
MNDGANVVVLLLPMPMPLPLPTLLPLLADNYATMKAITMPEQWYIKKGARMREWKKRKQSVIMRSLSVVQVQKCLLAAAATHNQVIMEQQQQARESLLSESRLRFHIFIANERIFCFACPQADSATGANET